MIYVDFFENGDRVKSLMLESGISGMEVASHRNTPFSEAIYLAGLTDVDKVVFEKDRLDDFRSDWENGESEHWDERTAKEWMENHYVHPTMKYFPDETDWEWG